MPDDAVEDAVPRRTHAPVNTVRAGIVVACFVVATILLLGPAGRVVAGEPATTTPTTQPPAPVVRSSTTVQVANGTTVQHAAEAYAQTLNAAGWDALPAEDVTPTPTAATQKTITYVYFLPHQQAAAQQVAAELHVPAQHVQLRTQQTLHEVTGASRSDVVVIIGTDLAH